MRAWLICLLELLSYTFGVMAILALPVEKCHNATYTLLGNRIGRGFWYATALPGAPVHELGHGLMCLLFCHHIEGFHLLPRNGRPACVEHSYNPRNPYAAMGNVWIGLGPLFSCLGVMLAVLFWIFPLSLDTYMNAVTALLHGGGMSLAEILRSLWRLLLSILTETTSPLFLRLIGWYLLLSMSQHLRLSVADLRSMASGIPWTLLLAAVVSAILTLCGEAVLRTTTHHLQQFALLQCALLALVLLVSLVCLGLAAAVRGIVKLLKA